MHRRFAHTFRAGATRAGFVAFCLFVIFLSAARVARACSCLRVAPCDAYGQSEAVFVATVTDITQEDGARDETTGERSRFEYARLTVREAFRGVTDREVRMPQGTGGGDCSFVFERGETYLIYGRYDAASKLYHTDICTRSRPLAYAADDLDYIRGLPGSARATRLAGTLVRLDYSDGDDEDQPELIGGIKVLAEDSRGKRFEAVTDASGFYKITGLPAGRYRVRALLPSESGLASEEKPRETVLRASGCADASFLVRTDGRIAGRVIDSEGMPVADATVDLLRVAEADKLDDRRRGRYRQTDADGRFEFTALKSGEYLIGMNLRQSPSGDQPFPRTFYPGVSEAARAHAVKLTRGEKRGGLLLRLPPRLPVRNIEGTFAWPDGRPVTKALVTFRDSPALTGGTHLGGANVDARGRFSIPALEGQEGWVHATVFVTVENRLKAVAAEPVKVSANASLKPVRLVASRPTGGGVEFIP
jgi:hypothetical protein